MKSSKTLTFPTSASRSRKGVQISWIQTPSFPLLILNTHFDAFNEVNKNLQWDFLWNSLVAELTSPETAAMHDPSLGLQRILQRISVLIVGDLNISLSNPLYQKVKSMTRDLYAEKNTIDTFTYDSSLNSLATNKKGVGRLDHVLTVDAVTIGSKTMSLKKLQVESASVFRHPYSQEPSDHFPIILENISATAI